ncbi:predicted protein [Naegleria gruberi]|uniref:Predicted protein n=1 Tax=Naegleria gruberi TaxID=5762 RepID=D2W1N6_NAEGR|nr:uncharacterized protein NAEGRDRAFT_75319 [Naegleria gruberi]EFC36953.1 predicted protein [Naegleria gruberi]|eukprot:XP_002669697.1 predicted protein [Naegleria gruberi strain NEG-M]
MSEFEYYHDGDIHYVNHHQQASNSHQQQQQYQSSYRSNDYSSSPSSSESYLDDGYVLFQSIQISIPILPFLIMMGFVLFVMGLRAIKYFQLSVNWHVITKSFKHQIILLSLFFQIPLLCFYLYSLIKFGKSDASLVLIIILNSTIGGMASFINEKSLGYFVVMLACFISSLLVQEAHVKTILICLCFLVVALKIQKIIFQRNKQFEPEDFTEVRTTIEQDDLVKGSSHNFRQVLTNADREGSYDNNRFYSGQNRFQQHGHEPYNRLKPSLFQNNAFEYNHQPTPTVNKLHSVAGLKREVHNDLHNREDIYVPKTSNWNWLGSVFSNMKWFSKKQEPDILERRHVKLQVPDRQKVLFDKPVNNVRVNFVEEREEREEKAKLSSSSTMNSYTPLYPSLSTNIPPSVKPEESPRAGISPYLLNHSLPLTQSNTTRNSMKPQQESEKPPTFQTKENFKVPMEPEEEPNRYFETRQQFHVAKRVQQVPQPESQSAFKPRAGALVSKQRPPIVHTVVEEEEFIPTASTFDGDDDEEE